MPIRLQGLLNNHKMIVENKSTYAQMIENMPWEYLNDEGYPKEEVMRTLWDSIKELEASWRKPDRIVWFLKALKMNMLRDQGIFKFPDGFEKVRFARNLIAADRLWKDNFVASHIIKEELDHFFALNYEPIQRYEFGSKSPTVVRRELHALEMEYIQKQKENARLIPIEPTETIIKDFGNGWAWVNLNRASCDKEGAALGHCGNSPRSKSNDRLISLRQKKNGKWQAALTFILEEDGYFGERKGAGNQAPAERYHPYIVELLSMDFYKGLKDGRWMKHHDFMVAHLSPELAQKLYAARPDLFSPLDKVRFFGEQFAGANFFAGYHGSGEKAFLISRETIASYFQTIDAYLKSQASNQDQRNREVLFRKNLLKWGALAEKINTAKGVRSFSPETIHKLINNSDYPLDNLDIWEIVNTDRNNLNHLLGLKDILAAYGADSPECKEYINRPSFKVNRSGTILLTEIQRMIEQEAPIPPEEQNFWVPDEYDKLIIQILNNDTKIPFIGSGFDFRPAFKEVFVDKLLDGKIFDMSHFKDIRLFSDFRDHPKIQEIMQNYYYLGQQSLTMTFSEAIGYYTLETYKSFLKSIIPKLKDHDDYGDIEGFDFYDVISKFGPDIELLRILVTAPMVKVSEIESLHAGITPAVKQQLVNDLYERKFLTHSVPIPEMLAYFGDSQEEIKAHMKSLMWELDFNHDEDTGLFYHSFGTFKDFKYEIHNSVMETTINELLNPNEYLMEHYSGHVRKAIYSVLKPEHPYKDTILRAIQNALYEEEDGIRDKFESENQFATRPTLSAIMNHYIKDDNAGVIFDMMDNAGAYEFYDHCENALNVYYKSQSEPFHIHRFNAILKAMSLSIDESSIYKFGITDLPVKFKVMTKYGRDVQSFYDEFDDEFNDSRNSIACVMTLEDAISTFSKLPLGEFTIKFFDESMDQALTNGINFHDDYNDLDDFSLDFNIEEYLKFLVDRL